MKLTNLHRETYVVKFNFKNSNGFWEWGVEEKVVILLLPTEIVKTNHKKAKDIILKRYPEAKIVKVTYI